MHEFGRYAKIQPEKDGIVSSVANDESLDLPVLIDHMARPDPTQGKQDPNLKKMLELLSKGNTGTTTRTALILPHPSTIGPRGHDCET